MSPAKGSGKPSHNAHLHIPLGLWEKTKARADELGETVTEVIIDALERFLGTKGRKRP